MINFDEIFNVVNDHWYYVLHDKWATHKERNIEKNTILDFFKGQSSGKFLEIGSSDGMSSIDNDISPTWALLQQGWQGIYCEPDPRGCNQLLNNLWDNNLINQATVVNAAVTPHGKPLELHILLEQCGVASFDSEWSNRYYDPYIMKKTKIITNTITFKTLLNTIDNDFDFLSIDIEGLDVELLNTIDFLKLTNLKMIQIESGIHSAEYLYRQGFNPYLRSEHNCTFIRK